MLRTKIPITLLLILLAAALLLAACGGGEEQSPAEPPAAQNEADPAAPSGEDEGSAQQAPTEPADPSPSPATEEQPAAGGEMLTYTIVPAESRATYTVDEEFFQDALSKLGMDAGINTVIGSTQQVTGELEFDPDTLTLGDNRFMVDVSTLESDDDRRDNWIRDNGPRLNIFSDAVFVANSLSGLPDTVNQGEEVPFQIQGDLTIHEVTVPVTFDARATLEDNTISGVMTTRSMLTDFGIEPPSFARTLTVDDEFAIEVEFTAVQQ